MKETFKQQFAPIHNFKKHILFIFMIAVALTTNAAQETVITVNNIYYRLSDPSSFAGSRRIKKATDWFNKYSELAKEKKLKGEDKMNVQKLKNYILKAEEPLRHIRFGQEWQRKEVVDRAVIKFILNYEIESIDTFFDSNDYFATCSGSRHAYGDIVIPEYVTYNDHEYKVVAISDRAFYECHKMTNVSIPHSIVTIGNEAFYKCTSLTNLYIPNSVEKIGGSAFAHCTSLLNIYLPDSLTTLSYCMFQGCNKLNSISIPNSVTSIGSKVFENCTNLNKVTIPDSVTEIGSGAFFGCTGMTEVTIPNSVTEIGDGVFEKCTGMTEVAIPNSVTKIGNDAFKSSGLVSITIPNSLTSIGSNAFGNCTNLKSVRWEIIDDKQLDSRMIDGMFKGCVNLQTFIFCDGIKRIPDNICKGMYNLKNIKFPNSVIKIGNGAFCLCTSLESISIPDSTEEIGEGAFMACIHLNNVKIPNSVTSINDKAFMGSGLSSIIIPNSVTRIGSKAFANCFRMNKEVIIPSSVNYMGDDVFGGSLGYNNITLPSKEDISGWALKWYNKALNGDPRAQFEMAECYIWGMGTKKNYNHAIYWAKKLAQQYHPLGLLFLYLWLRDDDCSYIKTALRNEAIKRATPLAEKGSAEAMYVLASLNGIDEKIWRKACDKGFSWAIIDRANHVGHNEAFDLLEPLAQQGHPMAQNNLGNKYKKAGLKYNSLKFLKKAEFWLKKAMQTGGNFFELPRYNLNTNNPNNL
jgi:hypothetical protein